MRTKNAEYQASYYQRHKKELKQAILNLSGRKCALCGYNDVRALEIDHINGGGKNHRRHVGGIGYYKELLKMATDKTVRTLCRNCNWIEWTKTINLQRLDT